MKRKTADDIGVFNILLIGGSSGAVSTADNIRAKFMEDDGGVANPCSFNIISDIDSTIGCSTWFNEFIFELSTCTGKFNNIIVSEKFSEWMSAAPPSAERLYMKKLLQAMNVAIVDMSKGGSGTFDADIPQVAFDPDRDFLVDLFKWIDSQLSRIAPMLPNIRLVRSLSGKSMPYLGDVFGCLSGKQYRNIIHADKMRFDVPILFDEFCYLTRGRDPQWIDSAILVRSNSVLASFFK